MISKSLQGSNTQFQMGIEGSSHLTTITVGGGIIVGNGSHAKPVLLDNDVTRDIFHSGIFIVESKIVELYPELAAAIPSGRFYSPTISTTHDVSSEGIKVWDALEGVLNFLMEAHTTRETPVVSIGGGALTDIAGLASSIYMRGTPLYTIPTTFLGMVDSSIGGKTGINFHNTKNVIGTFHHPTEVIVDINFLHTLSSIEIACGLMEVVKLGIVLDASLLSFVESNLDAILGLESESITHVITSSLRIKGDTVRVDASDQSERLKLNFGHTIAHPIESDSEFTIPHGIAVGMGMYWELCLVEFLVDLYVDADAEGNPSGSARPIPLKDVEGDGVSGGGADIASIDLEAVRRVKGQLKKVLGAVGIDPVYKPRSQRKFINTLLSDKKNLPNRILLPLVHRGGVSVVTEVAVSDVVDFCTQNIFAPPQTEGKGIGL